MYLLKLALRPWRKAPLYQAAGALGFGIMMVLGSCLIYLQGALKPIVQKLEGKSEVVGFLQPELTDAQEKNLQDQIRVTVGNAPLRVIERRELLAQVEKAAPQLANQVYSLGKEFDSVVPKMISIQGHLTKEQITRIQSLPGIESVEQTDHKWKPVSGALQTFEWGAGILGWAVWLAAGFGLFQLIRLNRQTLGDAVQHLEMLGASAFEKSALPIGVGASLGLLGGILGSILWLQFCQNVPTWIQGVSPLFSGIDLPSKIWALFLLLGTTLVGGVLGLVHEPRT